MAKIPKRFTDFTRKYPEVAAAYEAFGKACHASGPLDNRTRALVKFAISIGARLEGGAHAHVRKALTAGVSPEELRHVAFLAMPTIGFPASMAATSWIDDIISETKPARKKR
jgi:AhpD family alkylhydroperoxidase